MAGAPDGEALRINRSAGSPGAIWPPETGTTHLPVRSVRSESCGIGTSLRIPAARIVAPEMTITLSWIGFVPAWRTAVAPIRTFNPETWLPDWQARDDRQAANNRILYILKTQYLIPQRANSRWSD